MWPMYGFLALLSSRNLHCAGVAAVKSLAATTRGAGNADPSRRLQATAAGAQKRRKAVRKERYDNLTALWGDS